MKKGRVCSFLAALKKKKKRRAKRRLETIGVISVAQASGLPGLSWAAVAGGCLTGSGQVAAEAAVISGVVPVTCPVPGMEGSDPWVSARGSPGVADFSRGRVATGSQENRQKPVAFSNSARRARGPRPAAFTEAEV